MQRSRRQVLQGVGGAALGALTGCGGRSTLARNGRTARNVVVVLTDDQRWDSLSCLGHPFATPHLDGLVRDGVHFGDAFVTTSLCCPSRASMWTGLYAHAHGVLDNKGELPSAFPTVATWLADAGVDTAYIGKWHMGGDNPHPRPGWQRWIAFRGQGRYDYPGPGKPLDQRFSYDGEMRPVSGYVTDLLTEEAVRYIEGRKGQKKPFLMVLSHKGVHAPFVPAERHRNLYGDVKIPEVLPDTDEAYAALPDWLRRMRHTTEFGVERPYRTWADFASWYLDYHRTLLSVDDSVGRVREALAANGLDKDTAIVFLSDNGFAFGEKGLLDKRNFYEPSIRIPWFVVAPGLASAGTRSDELVLNVDLAPTVLELLGLTPPEGLHGRSIVPLLEGNAGQWRKEFVYQYFFERHFPGTPTLFGLRTKKLKLTVTHGIDLPDQLFDVVADPAEVHDLSDQPAYAERKTAMKARLGRHLAALGMRTEPVWGENWVASPEAAAAGARRDAPAEPDEP